MASTTPTPTQTRSRIGRPSGAMAVSLVALFMSLGGVGYAAATGSIDSREIKNNSVRSADLKNNDVRGKDIRTGTVTGSDVKDETLGGSDVNTNSLKGGDIDESSLGTVPRADIAGQAGSSVTAGFASNAGAVGGSPVSALQSKVRWVQVEGSDGTIRAQTGGITVTREKEGFYYVDFGASTVNAMISASGAAIGASDNAFVNAQRCGGPPLGLICGLAPNTPNNVLVNTDDPDDAILNDADFYLALVQ